MKVGSTVKWRQGRGYSQGLLESIDGDLAVVVNEKTNAKTRRKLDALELLSPPARAKRTKKEEE